MQNLLCRALSGLLGAFILLQPAVGYAFAKEAKVDRIEMKKNTRQMRAKMYSMQADKQRALQQKRSNAGARNAQGESQQNSSSEGGCCGCIVIGPGDFGLDHDTTYVITTPGKYTLSKH